MVGLKIMDRIIPIHSENLLEIFLFHEISAVFHSLLLCLLEVSNIVSFIPAAMAFMCISKTSLFSYFSNKR